MNWLIAVVSLIYYFITSQAQQFLPTLKVVPFGGSDVVMPKAIFFDFPSGHQIYAQTGDTKDSNNANYTEKLVYGVLKCKRISKNEFEYDATMLRKNLHLHLFPSSLNSVDRMKGSCKAYKIQRVKYTICLQKLSEMFGDSYGPDVVPDDDQQQLTVEVLVHIDYSLYVKWLHFKKGDKKQTIHSLKNYYSHIINGVNANYERINRPDLAISVHLRTFYVDTTSSLYTLNSANITFKKVILIHGSAVEAAKDWWAARKDDHHDAAVFFANLDMQAAGIAYTRSVCLPQAVMVVPYGNQLEITNIATHELAHILGSNHDGPPNNECNPDDINIMDPTLGDFKESNVANTFLFSLCSIAYFKLHFHVLDFENANCLLNEGIGAQDMVMDHFHIGQSLSIDEQCKLLHGPSSYHCGGDKVCEVIYCYNPLEKDCHKEQRQTAADGSQCGNKKWCVEGLCVPDARAPASDKETCIYGEPTVQFDKKHLGDLTCDQLTEATAYKCYLPFVRSLCCDTCPKLHNPHLLGCEYGDKNEYCESLIVPNPSLCRSSVTATKCCRSCAKHYKEADIGKL